MKAAPEDIMDIRPREAHMRYERLCREEAQRFLDPETGGVRPELGRPVETCLACGHPLPDSRAGYAACSGCGSLNSSPRLLPASLSTLYVPGGAAEFFQEHVYTPSAERRRPLMQGRLDLLRRFVPSGRVLEAGCSIGLFLDVLSEAGYQAEGVEILPYCVERCHASGHRVRQGSADAMDLGLESYDAIAAWEVLPHLYEPSVFVAACRRALRPGGHLLFTASNAASLEYDTIWRDGERHHANLLPHVFLQIFSLRGLLQLLESHGFAIREVETPGLMDVVNIRDLARTRDMDFQCDFFSRLFLADGPEAEAGREQFQEYLRRSNNSGHMSVVAVRL